MKHLRTTLIITVLLAGCIHFRHPTIPLSYRNPEFFIYGMSLVNEDGTSFDTPANRQSLLNLQRTGISWVVFIINGFQDTINSTRIYSGPTTPSVYELTRATDYARRLNLQVVYKFHIDNIHDSAQHWRGQIGLHWQTDWEWNDWFANYRQFIWPYLKTAERLRVPLICIGNELTNLESHEPYWRTLIKEVRENYHGSLVYGANWDPGPDHLTWWDTLDFIGVSAYLPLSKEDHPTRESLIHSWRTDQRVKQINWLSAYYRKPVIFTEIGYRSVEGASHAPWEYHFSPPLDLMGAGRFILCRH